ncbi:MAG: exodeoxyribonuclease VII small subunit [Anaerolineales bacterium]|jgi:exodeoxyribonuclease VII small subunit|nr:exodeoxyribonuclease VII small subunit [Anaerolineales bacterium]
MKPLSLPSDQPIDQLTYEQAFSELEQIVTRLESNSLDLEVSLALFERGQALASHCAALLDQAELKVQQITSNGLSDFVPES